jgi:hypothetical protein
MVMATEGVASSNALGIGTTINQQIFNRDNVSVTSSDTESTTYGGFVFFDN